MPRNTALWDERLFLPSLQAPETDTATLRQRLADMERMFGAAQEEIGLLTAERDELVCAIKKWAKADRLERQELLFETATQEMRTELKQLRGQAKRLKRENELLAARLAEDMGQRRLRA